MASLTSEVVIGSWIVNLVDDDNHLSIFVNNKDQSRIYDTGADIGDQNEYGIRLTTQAIEKAYEKEGDLRMDSITHREKIGSYIVDLVVDEDNHLNIYTSDEYSINVIDMGSDESADNDFSVRLTTVADARLIAAVPALLAACYQALAAMRDLAEQAGDVPEWNTGGDAYEACNALRAAIDKANGKVR